MREVIEGMDPGANGLHLKNDPMGKTVYWSLAFGSAQPQMSKDQKTHNKRHG